MTDRDESERAVVSDDETDEHDGPVCPACVFPVEEDFDYCPNCETPLSQYATVDPLKTIRTEGELFRRSTKAPSAVTVFGMWLIFLPAFLGAWTVLQDVRSVFVASMVAMMVLFYGAILYKVTINYFRAKRGRHAEEPAE